MMSDSEKLKGMSRLEGFSDGIFGFAVTLLILELKVPQVGENDSGFALWSAFLQLWPSFLALVLSFVTVLIMWMNHHVIFNYVRGADARFTFANGFLLLLIMMVPFPTALMSEYLERAQGSVACAIYSGFFVLMNIAYNLLWHSAARKRRLLKHDVSDQLVREITFKMWIGLPAYLFAVIAAFFSPFLSILTCTIMWFLWGRMALAHFVPKAGDLSRVPIK
jgi:uncharacterized membrane protein